MDDEGLIHRVARRDAEALASLYDHLAPHVHALARRMLTDPDEVKSVVQDTFVRVWEASDRFDADLGSARTWILTIAHRLCLRALRDRPPAVLPLEDWDAPEPDHAGSGAHLDRIIVAGALSGLEPGERHLVEQAFFRGFSHTELAVTTGWPLGTVKTRLRGALAHLRARLESV